MASPILDPKDGRVEDLRILEAEPHITLVGESGGHPSWIASSIQAGLPAASGARLKI